MDKAKVPAKAHIPSTIEFLKNSLRKNLGGSCDGCDKKIEESRKLEGKNNEYD